jgi:hypothetical protein
MSKIKIQLVEDEQETPSVSEWMWKGLKTLLKYGSLFVLACFAVGYFCTY